MAKDKKTLCFQKSRLFFNMAQRIAAQPYVLENSLELTRPSASSFLKIDGSEQPVIIDSIQVKRGYRLERAPLSRSTLHLDRSFTDEDVSASTQRPVYHRPTDMSNNSLRQFSFGKARIDPHQLVPTDLTSFRGHPAALPMLQDENFLPKYNDRTVTDQMVRARIANTSYNPRRRRAHSNAADFSTKRDELARHFMYTSSQQASYDDAPWDSKLPAKVSVPLTTFEERGSNPLLESRSLPSFFDQRTFPSLNWDRTQTRPVNYDRKPFQNVAPLPRAQQISGYSGCIGGANLQEIDNPNVPFEPLTRLRTEQPKPPVESIRPAIPHYTGQMHWTQIQPTSHHDAEGRAFTTTAAFHKPLPLDVSPRYGNVHGSLAGLVTTVYPQNPFYSKDVPIATLPHFSIRSLPKKTVAPAPLVAEHEGALLES